MARVCSSRRAGQVARRDAECGLRGDEGAARPRLVRCRRVLASTRALFSRSQLVVGQPAERPFRPSYVSALALTPEAILAGIEACGVLRSVDGGRTWSGHRRGGLRDCHELLTAGERVYEAGSGGLAVNGDGGRTWQRRRRGLDRRYGWSVAVGDETVYLAAAPYRAAHSRNSRARVFRSSGAEDWEPCTDELSSLPRLRAVHRELFAALGDGTLLCSADRGDCWSRIPVSLGGPARALLALP